MSRHIKLLTTAVAALMLVTLSGCIQPGTFSGGGTMPNPDAKNGKSTFTFSGDNCTDPSNPTLAVNYNGRDGTSLESTNVIEMGECVIDRSAPRSDLCAACIIWASSQPPTGRLYGADFNYRSKIKTKPGAGEAFICVQDNGEGANADAADEGLIEVKDGPFSGYNKTGPISGNVQAGTCS